MQKKHTLERLYIEKGDLDIFVYLLYLLFVDFCLFSLCCSWFVLLCPLLFTCFHILPFVVRVFSFSSFHCSSSFSFYRCYSYVSSFLPSLCVYFMPYPYFPSFAIRVFSSFPMHCSYIPLLFTLFTLAFPCSPVIVHRYFLTLPFVYPSLHCPLPRYRTSGEQPPIARKATQIRQTA